MYVLCAYVVLSEACIRCITSMTRDRRRRNKTPCMRSTYQHFLIILQILQGRSSIVTSFVFNNSSTLVYDYFKLMLTLLSLVRAFLALPPA